MFLNIYYLRGIGYFLIFFFIFGVLDFIGFFYYKFLYIIYLIYLYFYILVNIQIVRMCQILKGINY